MYAWHIVDLTGGGMRGMEVKKLVYDEPGEAREETLVLNFFMDCRDAMGANMINTTAEHLAPYVEQLANAKVLAHYIQCCMCVRCCISRVASYAVRPVCSLECHSAAGLSARPCPWCLGHVGCDMLLVTCCT